MIRHRVSGTTKPVWDTMRPTIAAVPGHACLCWDMLVPAGTRCIGGHYCPAKVSTTFSRPSQVCFL